MFKISWMLAILPFAVAFAGTDSHSGEKLVERCAGCHAPVVKKEFVHEPAKLSCTLCHDAKEPGKLHAEGNGLCLECHSTANQQKFESEQPVALYGGKATLPPRPFKDLHMIAVANDRGHPVSNHPVSRKEEKDSPAIRCLTCHNPHGTNQSPNLLVTEVLSPVSLCQRCHP